MKIHEILDKKAIKIGLESTDKENVLKELVNVLLQVRDIGDPKAIVKADRKSTRLNSSH